MRILLIDVEALGLDFAIRASEHGHAVKWFMWSPKPIRDGEGFKEFEIVSDWRDHMAWAKDGLIVTTGNCRYMRELDRYRDFGFKIFSPTEASSKLEIDRQAGMDALAKIGVDVPPFKTFDGLAEAEAFARKTDACHVFKPMGDEDDKSLTYVSCDPADMVGWLQRQQKRGKKLKGRCMMQEKIDMVCELGVSGWVGPEGFLAGKWQTCIEHKKLMDGERGPSTGEMGTVCQYVEKDKLATDILLPMEKTLRKLGHMGDFAVGVGIDTKGRAWPFEFTARLGWPAFYIQCASHIGDVAQWMRDLLDGKDTLQVSNDVCIGVNMAQPGWPYNKSPPELVEGNPITGLEDIWDQAHLISVMQTEGPVNADGKVADGQVFATTGELVLCVTALGSTVGQAKRRVYKAVDKVKFPDAMYRTDIGEKVIESLDEMHGFGYLKDMEA